MAETKKPSSRYTEDWLPVKNIANNCIVTTSNFLVTGVKIAPRNIFIIDWESQNRVLTGLKNFYD